MSEYAFPFWAVFQVLDNHLFLAEALCFPEISRLGGQRERIGKRLQRNLHRLLEKTPLSEWHRRHIASVPEVTVIEVVLEPERGRVDWRQPLRMEFQVVRWMHGTDAAIAFVPALGIEVISNEPEKLEKRLETEIRAALSRTQTAQSLRRCVDIQRASKVIVEPLTVQVPLRSPKTRQQAAEKERSKTPSLLAQVATNLVKNPGPPACGLDATVEHLAEILTSRRPRSVLLIGASGVGKTEAVRELVRQRAAHNLAAIPFWSTSGARLVAGMIGYGMWQERCQQVIKEAARRRAVVHLGNLVELMNVGKSEYNAMSIAGFLRPYLARGDLLGIAECTPEQVPLIEREDPHLFDVFQRLIVPEPDVEQGRRILRHYAETGPWRGALPEDTLQTLDRLHRRYATYSAYPGRPLRFLRNLLEDRKKAEAVTATDILTAFTRETGLPRVLLDPQQPLDLDQTQQWFRERVLGQPEAVELVVDVLATTKVGLNRPRRPIASLLFIGPTGVGKTEMAKTLAEFLFGSRQRLTRFDMSEFGDLFAVQRLVGGIFGSEGLLTARVREQPFSVLLLDEFEKAHPQFLDLMLQVLGEGRLTDAAGRLANFTNTVVILTSNLGAESFRQGTLGLLTRSPADAAATRAHFVRAVQEHVRPELFNRIDRIVPFSPLDANTIAAIAERHLRRLEGRDGIRYRGVSLQFGHGVAAHLARNGFDIRYGARPLVRAIERELLAPLAEQMNQYSGDTPVSARIDQSDSALHIEVSARTDDTGRQLQGGAADYSLLESVRSIVELRRKLQGLEGSSCVRELNNELFQLEREQKRYEKMLQRQSERLARASEEGRLRMLKETLRRPDPVRLVRLARLCDIADRQSTLSAAANTLEDQALMLLHGADVRPELETSALKAEIEPLQKSLQDLLLTFYSQRFEKPDAITLVFFCEDRQWLCELAEAYLRVAQGHALRVDTVIYLHAQGTLQDGELPPWADPAARWWMGEVLMQRGGKAGVLRRLFERQQPAEPFAILAEPPERLLGVALRLRGEHAAPRFATEVGLHVLRSPKLSQPSKCLVEVGDFDLEHYQPPEGIENRAAIGPQDKSRSYDRSQQLVEDFLLRRRIAWMNRTLTDVLQELIEVRLNHHLTALTHS